MATESSVSPITLIGEAAGVVWHTLNDKGPLTVTKLVKVAGEPRDVVMQAIGWLAREGKIVIEGDARSRTISLR